MTKPLSADPGTARDAKEAAKEVVKVDATLAVTAHGKKAAMAPALTPPVRHVKVGVKVGAKEAGRVAVADAAVAEAGVPGESAEIVRHQAKDRASASALMPKANQSRWTPLRHWG